MKQKFCPKLVLTIGLSLVSLPIFSAITVYGLERAHHFQHQSTGTFYIQVGTFSTKANAIHLQSTLKNKLKTPVIVRQNKALHLVIIGPLKSAQEVRSVAQQITNKKQHVPVIAHPPVIKKTYIEKDPPMTAVAPNDLPRGWFVGLGVGWLNPTNTNSVNFASSGMPGFPDDRYVANSAGDAASYSIIGGYQWLRDTAWFPAISLALSYTGATPSITGVIYQNDLPDAKNFVFKYEVSQQLPMATLKVDLYNWRIFMPYVSVGIGAAMNKVRNYADTPIPGETVQRRRYGFNSATNTNFASSVGAGLDYWISHKVQLSVGYQFTSSGSISTGFGNGSLAANRLTNKLRTNSVGLQALYFLD